MTARSASAVRGRLLAGLAGLVLLALTFKPVVENDGVGYFSWLHTLFVDRDLRLGDEYRAAFDAHATLFLPLFEVVTPTGLLADFFPVGPAILAAPFYLVAVAVAPGAGQFATVFTATFTLASLLAGLVALALCWRLARRYAPAGAGASVAALALATPMAYYATLEPSYSHTFSALAASAFVLAWVATRRRRSPGAWFGLGVLAGVMALVRLQDGPLAAILLLDLVPELRRSPRRGVFAGLLAAGGMLLAFLPQLLVDQAMFGAWLPARPAGQDFDLGAGHEIDVLFSAHHGLFTWSPVFALAGAGLLLLRDRGFALAAVYALLVETVINGSVPDWWGGHAFGARRFLDLLPFAAVGLAVLAARAGPAVRVVAVALLAAWNLVLVANLTYVERGDVDPGYAGLLAGQLQAMASVPRLFAQGEVGRDLLLWPVLGTQPSLTSGVALLGLEALCLAAAFGVALVSRRARSR